MPLSFETRLLPIAQPASRHRMMEDVRMIKGTDNGQLIISVIECRRHCVWQRNAQMQDNTNTNMNTSTRSHTAIPTINHSNL